MAKSVELVVQAKPEHGEGALWHAEKQLFYWVDITRGVVHIYDPASNIDRAIDVGQAVGTVVARRSGGLMLAVRDGFASLDLDTEQMTLVANPEAGKHNLRFNDGKCDPAGRFWAGSMTAVGDAVAGAGTLYSLDAQGQVVPRLTKVGISNGIVWTADKKTMYFIDTLAYSLDAYDYDDATGNVSNRRVLVRFAPEQGFPDGMTIDSQDKVWVAVMGAGKVFHYDPEPGTLLEVIELPTPATTSCALGGPNLDELYITTSTLGLTPEQLAADHQAGAVFKVKVDVQGVPAMEYLG
jgi:sugar lactone lactonase YvrE